jgi:hypothetical protein
MSDTNPTQPTPAGQPPASIDEETLKRALGAFKKRHKLTILDQESKLGVMRPMTGGKKAGPTGIKPPNDFPPAVWRELAARKLIKDFGGGFYTLP